MNEQFLLHANKAASVAKNMGLYSAFDDAEVAHDSKKDDHKAVLVKLARINEADSPNVSEAEKRPPSHSCSRQRLATSRKK